MESEYDTGAFVWPAPCEPGAGKLRVALGIALGYIVWKCGALFPGIFMHVIFNAYGMIEPLLLERIFGPELTTGALVLYGVVSGAAGAALGLCGLKLLQGAVLQKNAEATE